MSVLEREKFFESIEARLGDDTSDEAIQFLEDMTDTYNDMEARATGDGVDWKQRYEELDEKWKKKYSRRFFSGGAMRMSFSKNEEDDEEENKPDNREKITYNDLFS